MLRVPEEKSVIEQRQFPTTHGSQVIDAEEIETNEKIEIRNVSKKIIYLISFTYEHEKPFMSGG